MTDKSEFDLVFMDLFDAVGVFIMALAAQLPPATIDRMSAEMAQTIDRMRQEGRANAAKIATAFQSALHIPALQAAGGKKN